MNKVIKEIIKYLLITLGVIASFLVCIVCIIVGIQENNSKSVVIGSIFLLMILGFGICFLWFFLNDKVKERQIKKQLNNLNCKKGKNTFEHLMLDVLNKKADELLAEYIDTNNKHNPYGLHFKYKNSNNLNLCFSYQGFYTIFEISVKS